MHFILLLILASPPDAQLPKELTGKIVGVHDGDTITLLVGRQEVKVRLAGIDAPELGQDYGRKAKKALSDRVFGKEVRVETGGQDRYGRTIGTVFLDGSVNLKMVEDGWAWHYKRYSDDAGLADAEKSAKTAQRGLWADPNPTPPWEWRKQGKKAKAPAAGGQHWLNTTTGVRHNSTCKNFGKTKRGRNCGADEGKPCGICGG